LTEAEQRLFRHLSVFVGGFTLEAVEEVEARLCYGGVLEPANGAQADQDGGDSLLDRLTALVDKSFVLVEEVADGVRYRLLESMRAYALAQLSTQTDEDRSVSFQQIAGPVLCGPASSVHAAASPDHACGKKQALRLLSDREEEVLRLVAQGLSNKAIAKELIISPSTVNYHLTSLFNKLGVNTRAQAVAAAAQRDLL
jgi:DNA-binding NarL/FixJ family response regulator